MERSGAVEALPGRRDCPECRGTGTVIFDVCEVCFAEFDERHVPSINPGLSWDLNLDEPILELHG